MNMSIQPGAGIIVLRAFPGGYKVLALVRHDGILDIPKGGIDHHEVPLEAALRETMEECGITNLDFKWGFENFVSGALTCYVSETNEDPIISRNPHTGVMEHASASWVNWEQMMSNTLHYVLPCIEWAKRTVDPED